MARRLLHPALLLILSVLALSTAAHAAGWPGQLTSGTNIRYWIDGATTNWISEQWITNGYQAVVERDDIKHSGTLNAPSNYSVYRSSRDYLVHLKDWISDNLGNWVNTTHTNASGNLTNIIVWTSTDLEAAVGAPTDYLTATPYRALSSTNTSNGWHFIDDMINQLRWRTGGSAYTGATYINVTNNNAAADDETTWADATNAINTAYAIRSTHSDSTTLQIYYRGNNDFDANVNAEQGIPKATGVDTTATRHVDCYLILEDYALWDEYDATRTGYNSNTYTWVETSTLQSNIVTFTNSYGYTNTTTAPVEPTAPTAGTWYYRGALVKAPKFVLRYDVTSGLTYVAP